MPALERHACERGVTAAARATRSDDTSTRRGGGARVCVLMAAGYINDILRATQLPQSSNSSQARFLSTYVGGAP